MVRSPQVCRADPTPERPWPAAPGFTKHRICTVDDDQPGIRRLRAGRGFTYRTPDGGTVGEETRDRIKRLAIPPARIDVDLLVVRRPPPGHRARRGRKQYRYHADWRAA